MPPKEPTVKPEIVFASSSKSGVPAAPPAHLPNGGQSQSAKVTRKIVRKKSRKFRNGRKKSRSTDSSSKRREYSSDDQLLSDRSESPESSSGHTLKRSTSALFISSHRHDLLHPGLSGNLDSIDENGESSTTPQLVSTPTKRKSRFSHFRKSSDEIKLKRELIQKRKHRSAEPIGSMDKPSVKLHDIFEDRRLYYAFERHCRDKYCIEDLYFVSRAMEYHDNYDTKTPQERLVEAKKIYNEFLAEAARFQISGLPWQITDVAACLDASKNIGKDIFEDLNHHCQSTLRQHFFQFIESHMRPVPGAGMNALSAHPVDRFIKATLEDRLCIMYFQKYFKKNKERINKLHLLNFCLDVKRFKAIREPEARLQRAKEIFKEYFETSNRQRKKLPLSDKNKDIGIWLRYKQQSPFMFDYAMDEAAGKLYSIYIRYKKSKYFAEYVEAKRVVNEGYTGHDKKPL